MTKYTKEMVTRMTSMYTAQSTAQTRKAAVAQLASEFGLSERQVQGKLVAEKVWVKSVPKQKSESLVSTKESIVTALSILLGVDELTSLKNASKKDLETMLEAVNKRNDQFHAK